MTSAYKAHKGAISHDELLEMLVEMKHSPTKYTLSSYAKQGWDRACGLAVERFGYADDLYLFQNFLLKEYEDMKNRALAEPDSAVRKHTWDLRWPIMLSCHMSISIQESNKLELLFYQFCRHKKIYRDQKINDRLFLPGIKNLMVWILTWRQSGP